MERLEFRLANKEELDEIFDVFANAVKEMDTQGIMQWDEIYPAKDILQEDIEKQELYIGRIHEKIAVAYVLNGECDEQYSNGNWQYPKATYQVIHRLCVNPEFQNQGIGNRTMKYIEEQLVKREIESIRLDAFTENPFALKLYEKLGYTKVGFAKWRKGKFYLMEKKL